MNIFSDKKKRKIFIIIASVAVLMAALIIACAIYLGDYYRADMDTIEKMDFGGSFKTEELDDGTLIFAPNDAKSGFIFYPGGKVEHSAYISLMEACASRGIMCVLVEMPFNLAVFDVNAADGIIEQYPEIENWYIGGHSLGGSMAASYLADNSDSFDGLVLLGSYSTADISDTSLAALSVYGSEDKVMNSEKYLECRSNLPSDFTEHIIDGGCHAYFGVYGAQDGDGIPSVTNKEQISITANVIAEFMEG